MLYAQPSRFAWWWSFSLPRLVRRKSQVQAGAPSRVYAKIVWDEEGRRPLVPSSKVPFIHYVSTFRVEGSQKCQFVLTFRTLTYGKDYSIEFHSNHSTKGGFKSEDTGEFFRYQHKHSKSLSWAENLKNLLTVSGGKFKFSSQDSDLEYLCWQWENSPLSSDLKQPLI